MSVHEGKVTKEVKTGIIEGNKENSVNFSPDLVDERIKAGIEPLHTQISTLTELMDRLIQINSARQTTKASSWETRHQYESP